jgi:5'-nucleotidase (lipoprotein e(P4) family)
MTHLFLRYTLSLAVVLSAGCTAVGETKPAALAKHAEAMTAQFAPSDNLNAVLWQQTAAEYHANSLQSFRLAQSALENLLKQPSLTAAVEQTGNFAGLPPAVVVDVDETMLDNSAYQARLVKNGGQFDNTTWTAWCNEKAALPVPGAAAFSNFANSRGVRVFYLSNRDVSTAEVTRANLELYGFSDASNLGTFFFRDKANGLDSKGARRALIAQRFRIAMLIGDNLGDFHESYKASHSARLSLTTDFSDYWGSRWIMIANPSYGSWEQSLFNFDLSLSNEAIRQAKLNALRLQLPVVQAK